MTYKSNYRSSYRPTWSAERAGVRAYKAPSRVLGVLVVLGVIYACFVGF